MVTLVDSGLGESRAKQPIGQATAVDALIESLKLPEDEKHAVLNSLTLLPDRGLGRDELTPIAPDLINMKIWD